MFKIVVLMLLGVLCLLFLSFAMFNDNPQPHAEAGSMSYMMIITGIGILLSAGALAWSFKNDNRRPNNSPSAH